MLETIFFLPVKSFAGVLWAARVNRLEVEMNWYYRKQG